MAAALVLAQLRARMALPAYAAAPTLGLLYITDHYASDARELLDYLASRTARGDRLERHRRGWACLPTTPSILMSQPCR